MGLKHVKSEGSIPLLLFLTKLVIHTLYAIFDVFSVKFKIKNLINATWVPSYVNSPHWHSACGCSAEHLAFSELHGASLLFSSKYIPRALNRSGARQNFFSISRALYNLGRLQI
ncbi:hypothetical protein XELAEV_18014214mg [Xenopus laevis]|uniref:Uncharacterized protein n=1 Tax=Xenopus laevis TaxID=8355 RepID=A0A974HV28_XENLA|nr:hypothetical protein XELAEV_18014214mg [Xenopus laevis]